MDIESAARHLSVVTSKTIQYQHIPCSTLPLTTLPDGTQIGQNAAHDIIFANYPSGTRMIKLPNYVVVTSQIGENWFGVWNIGWFRLD